MDVATIFFVAIPLIAVIGALQIWLWSQDRSLAVLGLWGAAHLIATTGLALIAGRNLLPHFLTVDVANALVIGGYGLVWIGARRFTRRSAPASGALAGPAIWLIACQVPTLYPDLVYRVVVVSTLIATYDALIAREFLRAARGEPRRLRCAIACAFSGHGIAQLVRAALALMIGLEHATFTMPNSVSLGAPILASLLLVTASGILAIAVAKEDAQRQALASLAQARDAADEANLAKSRFLTRMSHELRTPLTGILGMAQALNRDPDLRPEQRQWAALLEQSGQHLLAIVNDLLDLARAELGRVRINAEPVRLLDIVEGSRQLVQHLATARNIDLTVTIDPSMPDGVMADMVRVRQILLNLLGNALKFTPPGGTVALMVTPVGRGGGVRFIVEDTGPGVTPEVEPHLFRDTMVAHSDTKSAEGTGMGLAISASLAQAMRGSIRYERVPTGGSRFIVDLPLPRADVPLPPLMVPPPQRPPARPGPQARTRQASAVQPNGVRVLVVDDVAANRRLAEVLLTQVGFTVSLASSGAEAVAAVSRGPVPDVILMDVFMPGMDGPTTTRQIRMLPAPIGNVPIIAVTADTSAEQTRVCQQAGMNGFLMKPFNVGDLVDVINGVLPNRPGPVAQDRDEAATPPPRPADPGARPG